MELVKTDRLPLVTDKDIVFARKKVREWALDVGFGLVDQTKVTTAASELARNTMQHGGGGEMEISIVTNEAFKSGLRLVFEDKGPGIIDIKLALTDGYTTGGGMGLGLSLSRRAVELNQGKLTIRNIPGKGCVFTIDLPKDEKTTLNAALGK